MKEKYTEKRNEDRSILLTGNEPRFSLIWLHGLGDSSEGFLDWWKMPTSPLHLGARICLLQAPNRKVTVNQGGQFASWYDIRTFNKDKLMNSPDEEIFNVKEIEDSWGILDKCVKKQVDYWKAAGKSDPYKRIFVGGFSQGCAIALSYGISCEPPVAGIIGYSGHLFKSTPLRNIGKTPILLYHGLEDPLLREKESKYSYQQILKDPSVQYFTMEGLGHSVDLPQMTKTVEWLKPLMPKD